MFIEKLLEASRRRCSLLCVGLDPDPRLAPEGVAGGPGWAARFSSAIVDATHDLVCAYKPNLAFFEALGQDGWQALRETVRSIPQDIPIIADAKRGDIGSSARGYATALFDDLGADAVTVNAYLGRDSLQPFLEYRDRAAFVLCRTSNPGARDFQDLSVSVDGSSMPLYEVVARRVVDWSGDGCLGLVVGATYPAELARVREIAPDLPLLVPGIGTQGGDLEAAVRAGVDASGERAIVSASRQVMYASAGRDWAEAARRAALSLRDEINLYRRAR